MDLLNKGFAYPKGLHLYRQGIRQIDDIWDSTQQDFLSWERVQERFRLTNTELEDWEELTNKISGQWCQLLEIDEDTADVGQWLGYLLAINPHPCAS